MKKVLLYKGTVYPWHCDVFGHMNIQFYMSKFDEAAWNLLSEMGFDLEYFKNERKGLATIEHHILYKQELLAGECIHIDGRMLNFGEKIIEFEMCMYNNKSKTEAAYLTGKIILMDLDKRKSVALNKKEIASLTKLLSR